MGGYAMIRSIEMSLRDSGPEPYADELMELTQNLREALVSLLVDDVTQQSHGQAAAGGSALESLGLGGWWCRWLPPRPAPLVCSVRRSHGIRRKWRL
jgi:hypothetical protein